MNLSRLKQIASYFIIYTAIVGTIVWGCSDSDSEADISDSGTEELADDLPCHP